MYLINNNFSISRLNNAEITAFFINVQKVLTDANRENLGVESTTLSSYNTSLQKLMDQVYTTTGSQYTQEMKAADAKRDLLYKKIRLKLQAVEIAEEGSRLLKYVDVVETYLLGKYGVRVPQMAYQEESAILSGFIYDLRDKLDDDAIEELGIEDDIAKLELANTAFIKAYNARVSEKADGDTGLTLKLRGELTEVYTGICLIVQYNANLGGAEMAEKAVECQNVIKLINVLLADAKKRLEQRTNGGGAGSEGSDDNGGENTGSGSGDGGNANTGGGSGGNTNTGSGSGTGNDDFVVNDGTAEY